MTAIHRQKASPVVMVVDDDLSVRLLAHQALEPAGFIVREAEDGATALSVIEEFQPDVVLLDVVMPEMDGFAACAAIRRLPNGCGIPVLMMTGLDDTESINRAYEVGATDFIVKPLNWAILSHRVRYILRASQVQETMSEQAIRDSLTNLYNRKYFNKRIQEEIATTGRGELLALLLGDLDGFKGFNNTRGQQAGDDALKAVAKSVRRAVRGSDLVFRWGGDEVLVVLSNTTRDGVLTTAERVRKGILKLGEKLGYPMDLSIGIALYPEHETDLEELIRLADRALYIAKRGNEKIHIGEEEYRLSENVIKVVFQPIVDVRMDRVIGYEALSRDVQNRLSILDLFKKYRAIGRLNDLKHLCFRSQLKEARTLRLDKVFINVDFAVLRQLQPEAITGGMEVILEISEAEALYHVDGHLEIATAWREQGYQFAIDDFGAGFISLPFISKLVPEYIKLDRSTVLHAVASENFRKVLKKFLLGLQDCATGGIIAEGIESAKELQVVKDLDICLVQGYLFGKPEKISRGEKLRGSHS